MKREIKFRAWNTEKNEWLYLPETGDIELTQYIGNSFEFSYDFDNVIIQQYTGLKDKNGKEAYDGDICQWIRLSGTIQYFKISQVPGGFAVNTHQDDLKKENIVFYTGLSDMQNASWFTGNLEVIGNIYETPELLTLSPDNTKD